MTEQTTVPGTAPIEGGSGPLGLGVLPALFVSPATAFRRLAADPKWVGPFFVAVALMALGAYVALTPTLEYSARTAEATMDKMGVPEAKRTEALASLPSPDDRSASVLLRNVGGACVGVTVFGFIGAGVLHLIARASGRTSKFKQTLVAFSGAYVIAALGSLVKGALAAASGTLEVTLGPGALIPDLPYNSIPSILLDLFDVFSLWHILVLIIGGAALWGVTRRTSFGICGTYWLLKAVLMVAGRLVGAWMMGAL